MSPSIFHVQTIVGNRCHPDYESPGGCCGVSWRVGEPSWENLNYQAVSPGWVPQREWLLALIQGHRKRRQRTVLESNRQANSFSLEPVYYPSHTTMFTSTLIHSPIITSFCHPIQHTVNLTFLHFFSRLIKIPPFSIPPLHGHCVQLPPIWHNMLGCCSTCFYHYHCIL